MLHALRSRPKADPIREQVLAFLRQGWQTGHSVWWTGCELARAIGHPYAAATVTAKLRDLRKARYGGHKIACRRCPDEERGNGYVYRYKLED